MLGKSPDMYQGFPDLCYCLYLLKMNNTGSLGLEQLLSTVDRVLLTAVNKYSRLVTVGRF